MCVSDLLYLQMTQTLDCRNARWLLQLNLQILALLLEDFEHAFTAVAHDKIESITLKQPLTNALVVILELVCILPDRVRDDFLEQFKHVECRLPRRQKFPFVLSEGNLLQPLVDDPVHFFLLGVHSVEHSTFLHLLNY